HSPTAQPSAGLRVRDRMPRGPYPLRLLAAVTNGTAGTLHGSHFGARRRSRVAQAEVCKTFYVGSIPTVASGPPLPAAVFQSENRIELPINATITTSDSQIGTCHHSLTIILMPTNTNTAASPSFR